MSEARSNAQESRTLQDSRFGGERVGTENGVRAVWKEEEEEEEGS